MTDHKETDLKKGLDKDDIELWREMTRDVERLEGQEYVRSEASSKPSKKNFSQKIPSKKIVETHKPIEQPQGRDLDRNTEKRLRRGELPIEGKLDLHGLNQGEARRALISFIQSSEVAGRRCVLVITGKGNRGSTSEGREPGVLKQKVPDWLYEAELGAIVLQAVPAQPKHGGDGALYVYLRRRRT